MACPGTRHHTTTVSQTPARVTAVACTVSGCSSPRSGGRLWLYAPGDPAVSLVSPASGPAGGGTRVTIRGFNLGCALGVRFAGVPATKLHQGQAALDCGSNASVRAVSPAEPGGSAGARVPVTVQTVESYFTGRDGAQRRRSSVPVSGRRVGWRVGRVRLAVTRARWRLARSPPDSRLGER